ncbi:hypothetical protein ILUMI_24726 [Ignelater luminosus]|uniref:G-protein coupled receptors family 1 profile domain-containing protein n=1 Tax=Ignelater luminosus TaxID=2038154 RepID=A0A8K0CCY0_IGNLU|nr:hypothetical protein ILUMI_24726 [Ignelater luminosus]
MALDHHWLVTVALVTSSLIAFAANLLLLLVFFRRRGLRTISNRFTINLLLTNLLSSVLLIPLIIVDQEFSSTKNLTLHQLPNNVEEQNVFPEPNEIIFQEEKEEIIESDAFERTEQIISDKVRVAIFTTNKSDNLVNISDISELIYSTNSNETDFKSINNIMCYVAQSTVALVCTASILSVLLIGIDQYFAVIHSLRYHSYIDKFRSMALIFTSWFVSLLFGIFGALTQNDSQLWMFCIKNYSGTKIEEDPQMKVLNTIYALTYFIVVILVPFVAICIIYVCIYAAARNNSERMRQSTKGNSHCNLDSYMQIPNDKKVPSESRLNLKANAKEENEKAVQPISSAKGLPKVQSAPNFSNLIQSSEEKVPEEEIPSHTQVKRTSSERIGFITNLKYKLSNASVFRYREETRAAKISILVIFMVLVCYIPYGLAVILNSHTVGITTPHVYNFISLVLLVLSNIMSPFLFAYRNRRIRRELFKFLRVAPARTNSSLIRRGIVRPNTVLPSMQRHKMIEEESERTEMGMSVQPFLANACTIPQVIITCKVESDKTEKNSILKRVCSGKNWQNYKKCSFITVPESCWQTDSARGSFSSASTQISTED